MDATRAYKGGKPRTPPPPPPPQPPVSALENLSLQEREKRRRRKLGYHQTLLTNQRYSLAADTRTAGTLLGGAKPNSVDSPYA